MPGSMQETDPLAEAWLVQITDRIWSRLRSRFPARELARFEQYLQIVRGQGAVPANNTGREVYRRMYYPGLDSGPFLSPQDCGVLLRGGELDAICEEGIHAFQKPCDIVDQTQFVVSHDGKDGDLSWDCIHLRRQGVDCSEHIAMFPATSAYVFRHRVGFEAIFSRLSAGACLDPHSDDANYVVNVAVPLHDSEATISAGSINLPYRRGEVICLEPSFMHSVKNTRTAHRDVLLFDIWHPELSDVEVEAMRCLREVWAEERDADYEFDPNVGPYRRSLDVTP